jgi:hypothetical protein
MRNKCTGVAGFLFGHDFQPVYETGPVNPEPLRGLEVKGDCAGYVLSKILDANQRRTLRVMACRRCGAQSGGDHG